MEVIVPVIIIVVYFVIWFLAASVFQEIAEMKGHQGKRFFWWCFWVGPVGMMMVIALPDRRSGISNANSPVLDELPDL